jgi:hypothetical protein
MSSQERKDKHVEKKTVEFMELAVAESLSIIEMGQVRGGHRLGGGGELTAPAAPAPVQIYHR